MDWPDADDHEFISRKPLETFRRADDRGAEDWIETLLLVERSTRLLAVDGDGALRIAAVEALDRQGIGECVNLMSFGWGLIQCWEIDQYASAAVAVATSLMGLTDHVRTDLAKTLDSMSHWGDGPEFFVLLCSDALPVDPKLLHPFRDRGDLEDPHWRDPRVVVPTDEERPEREDEWDDDPRDEEEQFDSPWFDGTIGPGARGDACFVVGVIGGEPSADLVRLADLSGGRAAPIRNAVEAAEFGEICRERYLAVVDAVERRGETVRELVEKYRQWDEDADELRRLIEAQQAEADGDEA